MSVFVLSKTRGKVSFENNKFVLIWNGDIFQGRVIVLESPSNLMDKFKINHLELTAFR